MRIIAEQFEPVNCKDCGYVIIATPKDHSGDVYVCPLIELEEVSAEGIDSRCPWEHLDVGKIANHIAEML